MSLTAPACPTCQAALQFTHSGELDTWVCPQGHGVALTLSEAYELAQDDELKELWTRARAATGAPGGRPSPISGKPMVAVSLAYDPDETEGTPPSGSVDVDVDVAEEVIWFDAGELEKLPADLPNPEPSAEELAAINEIRRRYGEAIVADDHDRTSHELAERIHGVFSRLVK
jgi:Zn-finger nucleic acid-binding protein